MCHCVDYTGTPPSIGNYDITAIRVAINNTSYDIATADPTSITQEELENAVATAAASARIAIVFSVGVFYFEDYAALFSYQACGSDNFAILLLGNVSNGEIYNECPVAPAVLFSSEDVGEGSFSMLAQGGSAPYSYRIGQETNLDGKFSNLLPGTYSAEVTDDVGQVSSMDVTINSSSALPVSLVSFTSKRERSDIILEWATASEIDHSHFVIEVSEDSEHFESLDQVKGSGRAGEGQVYQYVHQNTTASNFYRLRMVDLDGSWSFSPVVSAEIGPDQEMKVFPNPSNDVIRIAGLQQASSGVIRDLWGQQVLTLDRISAVDEIDLSAIKSGVYTIEIEGKFVSRFVRL